MNFHVFRQNYQKQCVVYLFAFGLLIALYQWTLLPEKLFSSPVSSLLWSHDGVLLGAKIASDEQWRFPAHATLPDKFCMAIVSFEDKRFFSHMGVDLWAVLRAAWRNINGKALSGASTLSMQVIRLSLHHPPRTYVEKIREILMAIRLEFAYEKTEILSLYAAHAPFGGNVVGLESAAWRYFQRPSSQLSWAEMAMLAVLPNSPSLIHPGRNRQALLKKRNRLLATLAKRDLLSALDLSVALREPLPKKPHAMPRLSPHLFETLLQQHPKQHIFHSTLDAALQRQVNRIVAQHAKRIRLQGVQHLAVLLVDHQTFEVVAYAGNRSTVYSNAAGDAIDLVRRPRSTGSLLKPFLYAFMLQNGDILPNMLLPDVPTRYAAYQPKNYDRRYRGAVPAHTVISQSLNIPAVRMLHRYGVPRFYDALQHMGMTTLHRASVDYGLSLILGGAETTLWDMAAMYANLASIAASQQPKQALSYKKLKILKEESQYTPSASDVGSAAAWLTLEALLAVKRPDHYGHWQYFNSSQNIAWKTGTSYGLRDAWSVGLNKRYTVAVWVGNASGAAQAGLVGVKLAAPVMFDVFNTLQSSSAWFPQPLAQMKVVDVCRQDGYLAYAQCATEPQWIPKASSFSQLSPYHHRVHLDATGQWQVHAQCENAAKIQHMSWFTLPPTQAYFYRQQHASYQDKPPFRSDCLSQVSVDDVMSIVYPKLSTKVYIPIGLDEIPSKVVFEVVHRDPSTTLYWHLDARYLGQTTSFHQQAYTISAGKHRLTIIDAQGYRRSRDFEVLAKEE